MSKRSEPDEGEPAAETDSTHPVQEQAAEVTPAKVAKIGLPQHVSYVYSERLIKTACTLPKLPKRARLVHELIVAYGLMQQMNVLTPVPASEVDLQAFHSGAYVNCLKRLNRAFEKNTGEPDDDEEALDEDSDCDTDSSGEEMHGLVDDCPAFKGVFDYCCWIAGATLSAARALVEGTSWVAINWTGGWHHASNDEAAGFCYVNDCVLGILELRNHFKRVLYLDIDLHHGDGVEDAFSFTDKVLCISLHKYETGFFPCTGSAKDCGSGKGKWLSLNVPLKDGIRDEQYWDIFQKIVPDAVSRFKPEAVVLQCGVDSLARDPFSAFNITSDLVAKCVTEVIRWQLPTLVLGGGGYNEVDSARCWAQCTHAIIKQVFPNEPVELPEDIPDHAYLHEYGPDFKSKTPAINRGNSNTAQSLGMVVEVAIENVQKIPMPK